MTERSPDQIRAKVKAVLEHEADLLPNLSAFGRLTYEPMVVTELPKVDLAPDYMPSYLDDLEGWIPDLQIKNGTRPPGPAHANSVPIYTQVNALIINDSNRRQGTIAFRDVQRECERGVKAVGAFMNTNLTIPPVWRSQWKDAQAVLIWAEEEDAAVSLAIDVARTLTAWRVSPPNHIRGVLVDRYAARQDLKRAQKLRRERWAEL